MLVIVLAIVVSVYLSKMLNKPIINITNEAKKLSKGNLKLNFENGIAAGRKGETGIAVGSFRPVAINAGD